MGVFIGKQTALYYCTAVGSKRKAVEEPSRGSPEDTTPECAHTSVARGVSPPSEAATVVHEPQVPSVDALFMVVLEAVRRNNEQRRALVQQIDVENGLLVELVKQWCRGDTDLLERQIVSLLTAIPQIM